MASNNSTSFSRAFGSTKDFVRGSASQFPFAPGGLDAEVIIEDDLLNNPVDLDADIDFFDVEGKYAVKVFDLGIVFTFRLYLTDLSAIAPGLDRSLQFEGESNHLWGLVEREI